MDATSLVQAPTLVRKVVTIPANAGTADTLASLGSLTAAQKSDCIGCKVCAVDTAGSDRAAIIVGDSTASLPQYIAAGAAYTEPVIRDAVGSYVKAASGAAISNVCVLFYMGVNVG